MSLEYGRTGVSCLAERGHGKDVSLLPGGSNRVIVGALAKDVRPGLQDVDDATLVKLARDSDVFFFVGAHYLTQADSVQAAAAEAAQLARALLVMKKANPSLVIHA